MSKVNVHQGVEKPRGPKEEKKSRGKVRFGGEIEVDFIGVEEGVGNPTYHHTHQAVKRPGVRHDRMDLYDF